MTARPQGRPPMTPEKTGLVLRLRDSCNCDPHNPCASQDECFDAIAAADAIEAQAAEIARLRAALKPFASAWIVAQASGQTAMSRLALIARDETAGVHFMRARAALNGEAL